MILVRVYHWKLTPLLCWLPPSALQINSREKAKNSPQIPNSDPRSTSFVLSTRHKNREKTTTATLSCSIQPFHCPRQQSAYHYCPHLPSFPQLYIHSTHSTHTNKCFLYLFSPNFHHDKSSSQITCSLIQNYKNSEGVNTYIHIIHIHRSLI